MPFSDELLPKLLETPLLHEANSRRVSCFKESETQRSPMAKGSKQAAKGVSKARVMSKQRRTAPKPPPLVSTPAQRQRMAHHMLTRLLRFLVAVLYCCDCCSRVQWATLADRVIIKDTQATEGENLVPIIQVGHAMKNPIDDKTGRIRSIAWYKKYKAEDNDWLTMGGLVERAVAGTFDMKELTKDDTHYVVI